MLLRGGVRRCASSASALSSSEFRKSYLEFFVANGHVHVPSSSVVSSDPSLLFVNAGMNQFKSIFLGTVDTGSDFARLRRAVNSQKCIRVGGKHNDLSDVGRDLTHHTFFEMLGNWSFGDYFKKDACRFAWEYLTEVLQIPASRLYVTYFNGDEAMGLHVDNECRDIWRNIGVPDSRILPFGTHENFWEMGSVGPCGPCSEIHYCTAGSADLPHAVNVSGSPVIEIWNLVFMQYFRDASGVVRDLPQRHIDCGMGFERVAAIMQNAPCSYDTDLFQPLITHIHQMSGASPYGGRVGSADSAGSDTAYRIVADHLRALCIAIADGVRPANIDHGYVLRQMIRRAARIASSNLNAERGFLSALSPFFVAQLKSSFAEVADGTDLIQKILSAEETQFWKIIDRGERLFAAAVAKLPNNAVVIPGDVAWYLYNTHGLPLEVTSMLAGERQMRVDSEGFAEYRRLGSVLSRQASRR